MDGVDRRLLDQIQAGVPLVKRPFAAVGDALGLGESEVVERLAALKQKGILRQISAIFDTARLGYRSALVAAVVPPERLEAAADEINAHPGVSHNYERDFPWNLWFTLAVPPDSTFGLEETTARLAVPSGCARYRLLPALRVFKIGVRLDMEEPGLSAGRGDGEEPPDREATRLGEIDRMAVRVLQEPFPLVPEPFATLTASSDLSVEELLARARELLSRGVIRRVAGLLHHRRAGFTANVMGVWAVPEARIEEAGKTIAGFRTVSHCYQRPTSPDWPYSIFSMIHGRSREECLEVLESIAAAIAVTQHEALWSLREFKKTRLKYFTPEYAAWERRASAADSTCYVSATLPATVATESPG